MVCSKTELTQLLAAVNGDVRIGVEGRVNPEPLWWRRVPRGRAICGGWGVGGGSDPLAVVIARQCPAVVSLHSGRAFPRFRVGDTAVGEVAFPATRPVHIQHLDADDASAHRDGGLHVHAPPGGISEGADQCAIGVNPLVVVGTHIECQRCWRKHFCYTFNLN